MCLVLAVIWTNDVTQTPTLLLKTGDSAQMYCHHNQLLPYVLVSAVTRGELEVDCPHAALQGPRLWKL